MMRCDLRRGYCLDGRLPCDLCGCFMPVTRTLKRISRPLHNFGSRMRFIYAVYPLRARRRKSVPLATIKQIDDLPEDVLTCKLKNSLPVELSVESKTPINGCSQFVKELICKLKGHDWETYAYSTGYYSYDVEQAGHCKRCGFDTHS